jgi:predicted acyltransferase
MYKTDSERLIRLGLWSVVTIVIGIGLSGGSLDSGPMPLNKNIWTLSFSFFTGNTRSRRVDRPSTHSSFSRR